VIGQWPVEKIEATPMPKAERPARPMASPAVAPDQQGDLF
jgi:hypothetical protein